MNPATATPPLASADDTLPDRQISQNELNTARNIFEYLLTLPPSDLDALYDGHVHTCKAVFRYLPPLAKHYVLRLVLFEKPVPSKNITQALVKNQLGDEKAKEAFNHLIQLRVILKSGSGGNVDVLLNPKFRTTFLQCMKPESQSQQAPSLVRSASLAAMSDDDGNSVAGEIVSASTSDAKQDKKPPSMDFLKEYARDRWEMILKYMVGATDPHKVQPGIKQLLLWSGLMRAQGQNDASGADDGLAADHEITSNGFQFLLFDTKKQVWMLLREYLNSANQRMQDRKDILKLLFELSFATPGQAYPIKKLSETQQSALSDLANIFGLVYMRKQIKKAKQYYPTPLAIGIVVTTGGQNTASETTEVTLTATGEAQGYVIVETNYRVYAYTSSALRIALLSLFIKLEFRTPNFVIGLITRESIRTALMMGITADQILGYLYLHSHDEMKKQKPIIPETVADQIRLWEKERNRVEQWEAYVYDKFPNASAFQIVEQFAKEKEVLLWSSPEKMSLACLASAHETIKEYIRKYV